MKREDLTKLGIEDKKVVDKIMSLHGKDIESYKTKVDEADIAAKADKVKITGLTTQLGKADETIKGFKKLDVEGVKKSAEEWEKKAAKTKEDAEELAKKTKVETDQQISDLKFGHVLDGALVEAKAKSSKAVKALLKADDLKLSEDGETIIGLEEQLTKIKTDNDYLFEPKGDTPKFVSSTKSKGISGDIVMDAVRKGAELPDPEKGD